MERKQQLFAQYVLSLHSDGALYDRCRDAVAEGDYTPVAIRLSTAIRRVTNDLHLTNIKIAPPSDHEQAYIVLEILDEWEFKPRGDANAARFATLKAVAARAFDEPAKPREFNVSYQSRDTMRRERHGLPWTPEEEAKLSMLFSRDMSLKEMCDALKRPASGIVARLHQRLKVIKPDASFTRWYYCDPPPAVQAQPDSQPQPQPQETETMATTQITTDTSVAFETKTVIYGRLANDMTEQELIDAIKRTENDIEKLKVVKTASKKIAANIATLEAQLASIVAVLDAR